MTIQTKYSLDQEVWLLNREEGRVESAIITGLLVEVSGFAPSENPSRRPIILRDTTTRYALQGFENQVFYEGNLFPTKRACLDSL